MTKDLHEPEDHGWLSVYPPTDQSIALGEIGIWGQGDDVTIITYANGYYYSRQAAKILQEKHGVHVTIIDLRWLAPLPIEALCKAVKTSKRILIVDEGRCSGSVSEAIMALLLENCQPLPAVKRLTAADSFIPLGTAWQYVLPSRDYIINSALTLCR